MSASLRIASPGWTGVQYSAFRIVFGVYLAVHFVQLAPWARELFSSQGMLASAAASPLYPFFPSLLFVWDAPIAAQGLVWLGALLAVTFAAGFHDRIAAVALWVVWASLFVRNPFIANPSLPFVGWLLIAHACVPRAPAGSLDALRRPDLARAWSMPQGVYGAAWIVMSIAYSYSGYTKLVSPSWRDGSALAYVLANPLARPTLLRELVVSLPEPLIAVATWSALALELLFAPIALFARARPWLWLAMALMHVGLVIMIDFADLSLGMLMMHFFTFDPGWLRELRGFRATRGKLAAAATATALLAALPAWGGVCGAQPGVARTAADRAEAQLAAAMPQFRERVALALAARAETISFAEELRTRHDAGKPLTGRQLERIRTGTVGHLALRDDLLELIVPFKDWAGAAGDGLDEAVRTKGVMLALTGALVLYDNFASSVMLFQQERRLRRVVNRPDPAFDLKRDELLRTFELYLDPGDRARVRRGLEFVTDRKPLIARAARQDDDFAWLAGEIRSSVSAAALSQRFPTEQSLLLVRLLFASGGDLAQRVVEESTGQAIAKLFGTGGGPAVPAGRLSGNHAVYDDVAAVLRPLDLLLDKSRYRAVDKVIPGYFTHVGIYLGSADELRARGLWEHPLVVPHHAAIESGATILEAIRSGVRLTTLEQFLYLDDLALLRPDEMAAEDAAATLLRGFREIGKPYDFNFDLSSTERMVCSELVYLVFPDLPWPTGSVLGKAIVTPDHVAQMAEPNGPLELVRLYYDGRRLNGEANATLARLASGSGQRPAAPAP
jgi:hypothetical protein